MPKAHVGDVALYYEVHGSGDPLLLIMGFGRSSLAWSETLLDLLAARFQVITFDNRGTGRSEAPQTPCTLKTLADDAVGVLDALDVARSHVFGISMGGMIAQEVALHHPDRVRGLVLGCTNCGRAHSVPAEPEVAQLLLPPPGTGREEAERRMWPALYPDDYIASHRDELERFAERELQHPTPLATFPLQVQALMAFDSYDHLPRIPSPTLVITGDADRLIPAENSRILAERIPGARLHVIPGAGHMFFNQAPEESARAVIDFLSGAERPG